MKRFLHRNFVLAFPLAVSSFFVSCVSNDYQFARHDHSSVSYVTYASVTTEYAGGACRCHAGGRYEPATYSCGGRTCGHRSCHVNRRLFAGVYPHSAPAVYTQRTIRRPAPAYRTTTRRVSH